MTTISARPPAWDTLEAALRQRRPVRLTYHGRQRTVCPHALGWKNNKAMLLAYQTAQLDFRAPSCASEPSDGLETGRGERGAEGQSYGLGCSACAIGPWSSVSSSTRRADAVVAHVRQSRASSAAAGGAGVGRWTTTRARAAAGLRVPISESRARFSGRCARVNYPEHGPTGYPGAGAMGTVAYRFKEPEHPIAPRPARPKVATANPSHAVQARDRPTQRR